MFMESSTLARPYAKALFDLACKYKTFDKWELMLTFAKSIIKNTIIEKLLFNINCIESFELSELLITIGKHNFDCFGQNFIRIMVEYRKLYLIPMIFNQFIILRYEYEKIIPLTVVTANSLTYNQKYKLIFFFEEKLLCKTKIVYKLDRSIIAGMIIYINDIVIDASIRGRVERLKNRIEV